MMHHVLSYSNCLHLVFTMTLRHHDVMLPTIVAGVDDHFYIDIIDV